MDLTSTKTQTRVATFLAEGATADAAAASTTAVLVAFFAALVLLPLAAWLFTRK